MYEDVNRKCPPRNTMV